MAEAMLSDEQRDSAPDLQEVTGQKKTRAKRKESGQSGNKTVVIQLPPKRRKVSSSTTIKHVLELIRTSVATDDRREAIANAMTCLDHNVEAIHDDEIAAGIDMALTKHLGYLLCRRDYQQTVRMKGQQAAGQNLTREISGTCKTLEMLYRGSVATVSTSFKRIGEELLPLVLKVIDDELCYRLDIEGAPKEVTAKKDDVHGEKDDTAPDSEDDESCAKDESIGDNEEEEQMETDSTQFSSTDPIEDGDILLCKATKTLGHFARVSDATQPMAFHQGLLSTLLNLITIEPYSAIPAEARLNSVWIIANLACNAENMVMMACHPELMASLIVIAARTVKKTTPADTVISVLRAQSIAVRALLNLSWAPENRIPMSEISDLVKVLSKLTVFRQPHSRGRTVQEIILQTRRHAVGALRNLASAPRRNKIHLCNYKNGALLNVLTDAVLNDSDAGVKKRAFAAISNLAVHDTARRMVEHPALVLALKIALQEDVADDDELKHSAHTTLMVLERSITEDMDCYQNLRELLDAVNPTESGSEEVVITGDDIV